MAEAASVIDEIAGPEEEIPDEEVVEETKTEEEPAPEAADAPKDEPKEDRHVPLAALHEERARRQELQQKLDQTSERMAKMEALWEQLQKQNAPKEDIPTYEDDPAGHLNAKIAQLEKQLAEVNGERTKEKEVQQVQQSERQMLERYAGHVRAFSQKQTDFQDAYDYLAKTLDAELIARGYDDPVERQNILQFEEGKMVGRAMRAGKDPAELIYNFAKTRGHKANGQDENKLERIEQGQKAAQTLSNANGKSEGTITLERLAELEGDEFDKAWRAAKQKGLLG